MLQALTMPLQGLANAVAFGRALAGEAARARSASTRGAASSRRGGAGRGGDARRAGDRHGTDFCGQLQRWRGKPASRRAAAVAAAQGRVHHRAAGVPRYPQVGRGGRRRAGRRRTLARDRAAHGLGATALGYHGFILLLVRADWHDSGEWSRCASAAAAARRCAAAKTSSRAPRTRAPSAPPSAFTPPPWRWRVPSRRRQEGAPGRGSGVYDLQSVLRDLELEYDDPYGFDVTFIATICCCSAISTSAST